MTLVDWAGRLAGAQPLATEWAVYRLFDVPLRREFVPVGRPIGTWYTRPGSSTQ